MWFPDKKLEIAKNRFKVNEKIIFIDKEGVKHDAKVLEVKFKSLNSGYSYAIELEEPVNGVTKYVVSESKLSRK